MATFGESLQREREMRAVTLEEISAATKISVRFLKAIEAGDLSKLPGGIFTRSFIRAYARYLGLDEDRVLAEYLLVAQPKANLDLNRMVLSKPAPQRESSRASLLAVLVAAVMLGGSYLLYVYSRRTPEVAAGPTNVGRVSPAPPSPASQAKDNITAGTGSAAAPLVPKTAPTARTGSSGPNPADTPNPLSGQPGSLPSPAKPPEAEKELVLQVAATERAWIAVDVDGKPFLQRVLKPNEVETVKARESFDVTTGNAQGIVLTLNGQTLSPLGGHGVFKKIHLTRDDLKNPTP